jgi:ATP-dependent protease ClpP protease subunit
MRKFEKNSLVTVVDGGIEKKAPPYTIFRDGSTKELMILAAEVGDIADLIWGLELDDDNTTSTVLMNTLGGYVSVAKRVSAMIKLLTHHGISTTCITGPNACSAGVDVLAPCVTSRMLRGTRIVNHQAFYRAGDKMNLANPVDNFRDSFSKFLWMNVSADWTFRALERAHTAFADTCNPLDDVTFYGWEFERMGLTDGTVRSFSRLADEFECYSEWPRSSWPSPIRRFFRLEA